MDYESKYRELVNDHIQLEKQNRVLTEALQKCVSRMMTNDFGQGENKFELEIKQAKEALKE